MLKKYLSYKYNSMSERLDQLFSAVKTKHIGKIKYFIKNHPELINQKNEEGDTPLHCSVRTSQKYAGDNDYKKALDYQKIAHYMVKHGGNISLENDNHEVVIDRKKGIDGTLKNELMRNYSMAGGAKKKKKSLRL